MQILVDTNILVRIAEPEHELHAPANTAVHLLRELGHDLCLVPQVHYEFWVVVTRPISQNGLGMSAEQAEFELSKLGSPLFRIFRDERVIYDHWRRLVNKYSTQGKPAHDARLVAAMIRHGVRQLLTFNAGDFARYSEIEVIDPRNCGV
jgi:predicted nucleic acid-binding protein